MNTTDILALIAIVISVISALNQWRHDSKINKINLEADYFKELYMNHLLHLLPKKRAHMRFNGEKLTDIDPMIDELNSIRMDSLYFLYTDSNFYAKLKNGLRDFEDFLITTSEQPISLDNQPIIWSEVQGKLEDIYDILSDKYYGK